MFNFKDKANNLKYSNIEHNTELGPKPLREVVRIKNLDKLPCKKVIPRILKEFEQQSKNSFPWDNFGKNSIDGQIAGCYTLMNWVGYYSDDFTSIKRNRDRFRASKWDMMHTTNARFCNFLISNDGRLLKKALACYSYLDLSTETYNVSSFLKEYFARDKL